MSEQTNLQAPVKRTAEFVLGLLGGIFGIFAGFSGLLFGGLGAALEADGAGEVIGSSWAVILLSALAIVGACIVKKHTKLAGTFYIAAAIGGTVGVSLAYIVPLILLLIGGCKALFSGENKGLVFKKWWFYVTIIGSIVFVMMFASSGSSSQESKSSGSSAKTTAAKTSEEKSNDDAKEDKTEFALNETADLDGTHITVTNVKKSMGNEYFKPKNGNEYVVVTLNIENKSDEDISYNPLNFQIQNEDGQITQNTFGPSDDDDLSSGNLTPNGKVSGTITFESKKSKTYKVLYTPEFWNDKKITFNLQ